MAMALVVVVAVIGYAIAGMPGLVVGAGAIMGLGVLSHLATPPEKRETFHQFQMRTNEMYRAEHQAVQDRRRNASP